METYVHVPYGLVDVVRAGAGSEFSRITPDNVVPGSMLVLLSPCHGGN